MGVDAFSLAGKHVVVVGASSGIGAATAIQCASAGASVSICARRESRLRSVLDSLDRGAEQTHRLAVLDVTEPAAIDAVFTRFASEGGPCDGIVYAAGFVRLLPILAVSPTNMDELLATNLSGAILCARAAVRRAAKGGLSIVFISSTAPRCPSGSGMTVYSASKAGLNGAVTALAYELAPRRIRVNAIAPGCVDTDVWHTHENEEDNDPANYQRLLARHPLGFGKPADVALGCVYLLSDASRWVTGSIIAMDGGFLTT
jgi:NAD(P)-dependent dehydrogenase (short-subunit alcohol dehydrogenase family)